MRPLLRIERGPAAGRQRESPPTSPSRAGPFVALAALGVFSVVGTMAVGLWLGGRGSPESTGMPGNSDAVVARVNGAEVTIGDVDVELVMQKTMRAMRGEMLTTDPADLAAFRRDILDQLVDQRMMEHDAVARGLALTAEEALAELGQWAPGIDIAGLQEQVLAEGVSQADYREWARRQVVIARYLRLPEVQQMGVAELQNRGGLPRPATASDIATALERKADIVFRFDGFGEGDEPVDVPMAREGSPAPDFALKNVAGETIRLSSLRGQPVVINFWATWCGPCKVEMPLFEHVYKRNVDKGLVILAVNVQEQAPAVAQFVEQFGMSFPVVLDDSGQVATLYRVRGLPTSIFVSPDGVIELAHRGSVVQRETLLEMVRRILPEAGT